MGFDDELSQLGAGSYLERIDAASALATSPEGVDALIDLVSTNLEPRMVESPCDPRALIAVRALARAPEATTHRGQQIAELFATVVDSPQFSDVRGIAAWTRARLDPDRGLKALVALARTADRRAAREITHGLKTLAADYPEGTDALSEVMTAMLLSDDIFVRAEAAWALGEVYDDRVFAASLEAIRANPAAATRLLSSLVRSPRTAVHEATVISVLGTVADSQSAHAAYAAEMMAHFPIGRRNLRELLARPGIHRAALRGLAACRDIDSVPLLLDKLNGSHSSEEVRAAVRALGQIGDPSSASSVAAQLANPEVCCAVADALSHLGQPGVDVLVANVDTPDAVVRGAVRATMRRRRAQVVPHLVREVSQSGKSVRARTARVLGWLDEPSAAAEVAKLLHEPLPELRIAALDAIAMMSSKPSAKEMGFLLKDAVPEVRAAAAHATPVTSELTLKKLTRLLRDSHSEVRLAATNALGVAGRPSAVPALLGRLEDEDVQVRVAAARSLAIGGPAVASSLSSVLRRDDPPLSAAAARTMAALGPKGVAALRRAGASAKPELRAAVAASAEVLGQQQLGLAKKLLDDPEAGVRIATARALARRRSSRSARQTMSPIWPGLHLEPIGPIRTDLIGQLGHRIRSGDERESRSMVDALLAVRDVELGPAVVAELTSVLRSQDVEPAQQVALGIASSMNSLDLSLERFPGWFYVDTDNRHVMWLSLHAQALIEALEDASDADQPTSWAARLALTSVRTVLEQKRRSELEDHERRRELEDYARRREIEDYYERRREVEDYYERRREVEDYNERRREVEDYNERLREVEDYNERLRELDDYYDRHLLLEDYYERRLEMEDYARRWGIEDFDRRWGGHRYIANFAAGTWFFGSGAVATRRPEGSSTIDDGLIARLTKSSDQTGSPRYLDATLLDHEDPLPRGSALREGNTYKLEIAIRSRPTGIPAVGDRVPMAGLTTDVDEAEILVVVEPSGGLEVDRNASYLRMPSSGDSVRNAVFVVTATTPTPTPESLAGIRVRLYYRLCLLESAVIMAEVVSRFRPDVRSVFDFERPITLEHDRIERGYVGLADEIERSLHIDVTRGAGGYVMRFTWIKDNGEAVSVPAELPLTTTELAAYIDDARRALLQVTMGGPYATSLKVNEVTYLDSMRALAKAGQDMHTLIFVGGPHSPMSLIGKALTDCPLPAGVVIQVSVDQGASDFVLPWAIIYDKELPTETYEVPDPVGFWGARYVIEQRPPLGESRLYSRHQEASGSARMSYLLWGEFRNAEEHSEMLQSLAEASHGKFSVSSPITRASEALKAIREMPRSEIYYFYTHAHTRDLDRGDSALRATLGLLAEESSEYERLKAVYDRVENERDKESWIRLSHGELKLRELERAGVEFDNEPLVFVNACESARLTPAMTRESFVNFFLSVGASAFIGTECTMTIVFAHAFGERVVSQLLDGKTVGQALLAARADFLREGNPLGLAYSVYGNSGRTFFPVSSLQPT